MNDRTGQAWRTRIDLTMLYDTRWPSNVWRNVIIVKTFITKWSDAPFHRCVITLETGELHVQDIIEGHALGDWEKSPLWERVS